LIINQVKEEQTAVQRRTSRESKTKSSVKHSDDEVLQSPDNSSVAVTVLSLCRLFSVYFDASVD